MAPMYQFLRQRSWQVNLANLDRLIAFQIRSPRESITLRHRRPGDLQHSKDQTGTRGSIDEGRTLVRTQLQAICRCHATLCQLCSRACCVTVNRFLICVTRKKEKSHMQRTSHIQEALAFCCLRIFCLFVLCKLVLNGIPVIFGLHNSAVASEQHLSLNTERWLDGRKNILVDGQSNAQTNA